ncbi:hypothetical protein COLO4_26654 [Corchorus olitorius]|uniref:Uncharacterized protein n=1 Tax=Corchorus olitorius TaxID=93759 RepID=A0A1R3HV07_9ROSI|nr:hypothetical protein COLO4_26654 [Corchorus olitorius]
MFVKVVHPGGHVELHDRPVLAAEIICRNPRCVVAHPNVFQQPSAIVAPETLLIPGQKFYVVPISTIRKLQRLSNKYSPSSVRQQTPTPTTSKSQSCEEHDLDNRTDSSSCWFFKNKKSLNSYEEVDHDGVEKDGSCFSCIKSSSKSSTKVNYGDDSGEELARSTTNFMSPDQSRVEINRKRTMGFAKGSAKRRSSFEYQWQPSLASINESEE